MLGPFPRPMFILKTCTFFLFLLFFFFCFFFFGPRLAFFCSAKKKGGLVVIKKEKKKGPESQKKKKEKKKKRKGMKNQEAAQGYTPLFGMAYNPLSVSAFGYLSLPTLDFDDSHKYTSFM
jgi:hypothetical protein